MSKPNVSEVLVPLSIRKLVIKGSYLGWLMICPLLMFHCKARTQSVDSTSGDPIWVSYCDLMKKPEKYSGKVIATEAITLVNNRPILHGDPEFLYSPECNNPAYFTVTEFGGTALNPTSKAVIKFRSIVDKTKNKKRSARVKSIIIGRFFYSSPGLGFGDLGAFRMKISVLGIDSVAEVQKSLPWPLNYKFR